MSLKPLYHSDEFNEKPMIRKYLKDHADVWINFNTELGEPLYSVQVCGTDFWLNSFKTKKEAQGYIKKHNLPVAPTTVIINGQVVASRYNP